MLVQQPIGQAFGSFERATQSKERATRQSLQDQLIRPRFDLGVVAALQAEAGPDLGWYHHLALFGENGGGRGTILLFGMLLPRL